MIPLLKSFLDRFEKKELIGLDLGSHSAKIVKIKREASGGLALEGGGLVEASPQLLPLRQFLEEASFKGLAVASNAPEEIVTKRIDLPAMPEADMEQAVRWLVKDSVEGSIDLYSVRSLLLDELATGGMRKQIRLALVIKKEVVEKRAALLSQLGLAPVSIEPTATALLATFDANEGWVEGKKEAFIELGLSKTLFLVFSDQKLLFYRALPITMMKSQKGEPQDSFGPLAVEIQRAIDAFCVLFHLDKVDRIHLSGGGALLPGIDLYLSKNMGIETTLFDPFKRVHLPSTLPIFSKRPLYSVAVGLALTETRRG